MTSSARRALKVLELIAASDHPMGVTEIARNLEQSPGTIFRTLDALQKSSYADRYRESSRYVLGPAGFRLRQSLFAQFKIRDAALPFLRQIASSTGETASLIVPLGWYGLRIANARGSNEVTNVPPLGVLGPLHQHYASKAILASFGEERLAAHFTWAGKRADAEQVLRGELSEIARRGFAHEGAGAQRAALALPIRKDLESIAALAIEGPVYEPGTARGRDTVRACADIVRMIEQMVTARPHLFVNPFGHVDPDTIVLAERP